MLEQGWHPGEALEQGVTDGHAPEHRACCSGDDVEPGAEKRQAERDEFVGTYRHNKRGFGFVVPTARVRIETFPSAGFPSLEAMVARFRGDAGTRVSAAAIGVAGPIVGGTAVLPNLAWSVDATRLASLLGVPGLALLNDVEASVWALELLGDDEAASLLPGKPVPGGNQAVASAGGRRSTARTSALSSLTEPSDTPVDSESTTSGTAAGASRINGATAT